MKTLAGYSDHISVHPGDEISFFVSSEDEVPYQARIIRVIQGDLNPAGPGYKEEAIASEIEATYEGARQAIRAGSYAVVPPHPALDALSSFTVQAMIWPTTPHKGEQTILACWNNGRGFALGIDAAGSLRLQIGDGRQVREVTTGKVLETSCWYSATGSFDAVTGILKVSQQRLDTQSLDNDQGEGSSEARDGNGGFAPAKGSALTIAAQPAADAEDTQVVTGLYNGKIDSPRLFSSALTGETASQLLADIKTRDDLVAAWDFSLDMASDRINDVSRNALHGATVNMPGRAMTGHNWTGEEMNWNHRPDHYGAIHFHDDDLYDAGWRKSFSWRVPAGLKSGVYAAHVFNAASEDFIPFVIRAPRGARLKKLVFLLPTASYMAYANEAIGLFAGDAELVEGKVLTLHEHDLFLLAHPEYGLSLYDHHTDGSGSALSSRLRPIMNMRPKAHTHIGAGSQIWQFNADTHILDFLEESGFDFDVITDEDLDREGIAALEGCECLLTGTHPEYHSEPMFDAIDAFKERGGRLVYMGGNGFYWRVAFHPTKPGIIELRRGEGGIRPWAALPGEYYHAFTGEYGGMWHRSGRPPFAMTGAGCTAQGFDVNSYYRRTPQSHDPRAAFIFEGIEGDIIGDFGLIGGGAAGLEIDRADYRLGTPHSALIVASSENHSDTYLMVPEDIWTTTIKVGGAEHPLIHADLVFTPLANGAAMFAMSSIAWAGSLSHNGYDNNVAQLSRNVLKRFLDSTPFA